MRQLEELLAGSPAPPGVLRWMLGGLAVVVAVRSAEGRPGGRLGGGARRLLNRVIGEAWFLMWLWGFVWRGCWLVVMIRRLENGEV